MTLPIILAVLVTNIAPDGVNTIITDTETGVTQSTCAYVWPRACADINVGVVPDEFLKGSPQTVLIPGADKSYVVMSEEWYADLTNRLASTERVVYVVRSDYEKTEEGRVKLHGKRVRTSQNLEGDDPSMTYFYEDGWHFVNHLVPRRSNTPTGTSAPAKATASAPSVGADLRAARNPRYAAALKRREAAKKPVEKTIIHMGGAR